MADGIIRSLAPDAVLPSLDIDAAPLALVRGNFFSGLQSELAAPTRARGDAAPSRSNAAWSFEDAIARIDATARPRSSRGTSLREKVGAVSRARQAQVDAGRARVAAGQKRAREEARTVEEPGDEDEESAAGGAERAGKSGGEDVAEFDEEEEDEEDCDGDGFDSGGARGRGQAVYDAGMNVGDGNGADSDMADDFAETLASARPNPHRIAATSDDAGREASYASYFSADPFSVARAKAAAAAAMVGKRKGRGRTDADAADGADGDALRDLPVARNGGRAPASEEVPSSTLLSEPTNFTEMNLSRSLLKAISTLGYKEPTRIQRRTVPLALAGHVSC